MIYKYLHVKQQALSKIGIKASRKFFLEMLISYEKFIRDLKKKTKKTIKRSYLLFINFPTLPF
jgi:hypothetical protein